MTARKAVRGEIKLLPLTEEIGGGVKRERHQRGRGI